VDNPFTRQICHNMIKILTLFVDMRMMKLLAYLLLLAGPIYAQDAVIISEGNFVRGQIKGTNFSSVALLADDQNIKEYQAKDIHSFLWNGETYVSKPIVVKKKMEHRFFKLLEGGAVNLYAYGEKGTVAEAPKPKVKVRPSIGVGLGSGGFGGGLGGGISIGGGRRDEPVVANTEKVKVTYFIEKIGTGPMQQLVLDNSAATKNILLQKLAKDEGLTENINATTQFELKNILALIKSYNAANPN
jgi:hypothetical protein